MPALIAKQNRLRLKAVPAWLKRAQTIRRAFKFSGFPNSLGFVGRIVQRAQKCNRHPDIDVRFNKVPDCVVSASARWILDTTPYGCQQDFEVSLPGWPQKPTYG